MNIKNFKLISLILLSLMLVVMMVLTIFPAGVAGGESESIIGFDGFDKMDEMDEGIRIMTLQARALEAHQALWQTFTVNPDGSVTYPDNFAGTWIDADFNLRIALTSEDNRAAALGNGRTLSRNSEFLRGFEDVVVFETAEFSLNELDELRRSVVDILRKEFLVVSHGVDVITNRIEIDIFELYKLNEADIMSSLSEIVKLSSSDSPALSDVFYDRFSGRAGEADLFVLERFVLREGHLWDH